MGYKNFKQNDSKWRSNYYSGGTISAQGCGPTSIADAVYDLDPSITPAKTAKWMEDNGCSCHGSGTYYSGMVKALKHFGYSDSTQLNYTSLYGKKNNSVVTDFLRKIKSGKYIGIACMGKSIWTTSGHYVFIRKVTKEHIYIYDPWNSGGKCETTNRESWEKYVKYLFLIKKPIKKVKTTVKGVLVRKEPKVLAKTKKIATLSKSTIIALSQIKKVNKTEYGKIMGGKYDGKWIRLKKTKEI